LSIQLNMFDREAKGAFVAIGLGEREMADTADHPREPAGRP
jgi:hypothetical protein